MANSLSASFVEHWAAEQQAVFYKTNVAKAIADMSFNSQLRKGDSLNRPYRSTTTPQVYTRGTAITINDLTDTNEQLVINKQYADGFYVDDFDAIQSNYNIAINYGRDQGEALANQVDSDVLGEVFNATSTIDDGSIGGTSWNGITISTSNIVKIFSGVKKKIKKQNVTSTNYYGVISADVQDIVEQYVGARATDLGDKVTSNGFVMRLHGIDLYSSNQCAGSAVLSLATNPTANDTITIEGVTFTFVASPSAAGDIDIGASADATRANIETLLNAPGTTTATGIALTGDDLKNFQAKVSATNDNSADTLLVKYKGVDVLTVSETLTDGTDTWTTAKIKQHCLFGIKGNPVCVVQRAPKPVLKDVPDKLGKNVLNGVLYGVKTFADNAKQMVNVEIAASTFA